MFCKIQVKRIKMMYAKGLALPDGHRSFSCEMQY